MTQQTKTRASAVVGKLADRGEEATSRLLETLARNEHVVDALRRASSARGKLDAASRTALLQIGLAPAEDLRELSERLERLEKRLGKLEAAGKRGGARAGAARTASTRGGRGKQPSARDAQA